MTVGEVWDREGGWNQDLFVNYLREDGLKQIEVYQLVQGEGGWNWDDFLYGKFIIRSVLKLING